MLHAGYLYGGTATITDGAGTLLHSGRIGGLATGIGGAARVHLGKHLRVGCEGYVTTLGYGDNDSYASIGWGGVLADCLWRLGRFSPFAGATFGGGSYKNLTLTTPTPVDNIAEGPASFRKYGFLTVVPFAGVEFAMTGKIHIALKADWMVNLTNRQSDFVSGPRIYIGFAFYRLKNSGE